MEPVFAWSAEDPIPMIEKKVTHALCAGPVHATKGVLTLKDGRLSTREVSVSFVGTIDA